MNSVTMSQAGSRNVSQQHHTALFCGEIKSKLATLTVVLNALEVLFLFGNEMAN